MIVDAWIQHGTAAFLRLPMFASLLRWRGIDPAALPEALPDAFTLSALAAASVDVAWSARGMGRKGRSCRTTTSRPWCGRTPEGSSGSRRSISQSPWSPCASCGGRCASSASSGSDACRGCGAHPRTTGATTRCTRSASSCNLTHTDPGGATSSKSHAGLDASATCGIAGKRLVFHAFTAPADGVYTFWDARSFGANPGFEPLDVIAVATWCGSTGSTAGPTLAFESCAARVRPAEDLSAQFLSVTLQQGVTYFIGVNVPGDSPRGDYGLRVEPPGN